MKRTLNATQEFVIPSIEHNVPMERLCKLYNTILICIYLFYDLHQFPFFVYTVHLGGSIMKKSHTFVLKLPS